MRRSSLQSGGPGLLDPETHRVLVQMMHASPAGATHAAAALWLQACYVGGPEALGAAGAMHALCGLLTAAVLERRLRGPYCAQAAWLATYIRLRTYMHAYT